MRRVSLLSSSLAWLAISPRSICCHTTRLARFYSHPSSLYAVVMTVLEKWALHRAADHADDNVALSGSFTIYLLASEDNESRARWLTAGAEGVLRGIAAADNSAKSTARAALKHGLNVQA